MKKLSYETMVRVYGKGWADRCRIEESGIPKPKLTQERGCEKCCGYGWPGWIVNNLKWEKCSCWKDGNVPVWYKSLK